MKKVYLIALVMIFAGTYSAQAQFLQFGVKGGLNFPSLNDQDNNVSFDNKTGWHAGLAVEANVPIVKVGAEFLYSSSNFKVDPQGLAQDLKTATFDIPVYAKLKLFKILQIHTGPQFSFLMSADLADQDIKDQWENSAFQWMAGAGVRLGPLDVHARFIFPSKTTLSSASGELKNSNIQVSAAFWFGGNKD